MIVQDLIYAGFRDAGIVLEAQRGFSNSDKADGLLVLNRMLDAWKAERAMVFAVVPTTFTIQPNKATYTIGPSGADIAASDRPEAIERANVIYTNSSPNPESPLRVLLSEQEWQTVSPKTMKATIPSVLYYERLTGNGLIHLWQVPTVANQVAVYLWQTVNQFAAIGDTIALPTAYQEAIETNLALRLAARFPDRQHISQITIDLARQSRQRVRASNTPVLLMQTEAAARGTYDGGRYNILTNRYV
jgi:hypothetical protein